MLVKTALDKAVTPKNQDVQANLDLDILVKLLVNQEHSSAPMVSGEPVQVKSDHPLSTVMARMMIATEESMNQILTSENPVPSQPSKASVDTENTLAPTKGVSVARSIDLLVNSVMEKTTIVMARPTNLTQKSAKLVQSPPKKAPVVRELTLAVAADCTVVRKSSPPPKSAEIE